MKKLLIGLVALSSFSAFAISQECASAINDVTVKAMNYGNINQIKWQTKEIDLNLLKIEKDVEEAKTSLKEAVEHSSNVCK
jgi:hypothetical protein